MNMPKEVRDSNIYSEPLTSLYGMSFTIARVHGSRNLGAKADPLTIIHKKVAVSYFLYISRGGVRGSC